MKAMGLNVGLGQVKKVLSTSEVNKMVATGLNLNGHLCAELISILPLKVKSTYEVACIAYRGGSSKKSYIIDSLKEFCFLPITDFGLHEYAEKHYQEAGNYSNINNLIQSQEEVLLRIGISRFHEAKNGKAGFWIQVNGIYSFPEYFEAARQL